MTNVRQALILSLRGRMSRQVAGKYLVSKTQQPERCMWQMTGRHLGEQHTLVRKKKQHCSALSGNDTEWFYRNVSG